MKASDIMTANPVSMEPTSFDSLQKHARCGSNRRSPDVGSANAFEALMT
jgi:hypothetical protein